MDDLAPTSLDLLRAAPPHRFADDPFKARWALLRAEDAKLLPNEPEIPHERNALLFPDD